MRDTSPSCRSDRFLFALGDDAEEIPLGEFVLGVEPRRGGLVTPWFVLDASGFKDVSPLRIVVGYAPGGSTDVVARRRACSAAASVRTSVPRSPSIQGPEITWAILGSRPVAKPLPAGALLPVAQLSAAPLRIGPLGGERLVARRVAVVGEDEQVTLLAGAQRLEFVHHDASPLGLDPPEPAAVMHVPFSGLSVMTTTTLATDSGVA